ncbi:BCCT family transporter [Naumannella halotolerans]|uniref:Choline/carnitine/betaine transport n=1 Tax=Naumannella halotolerans TaxID=993414 RepID=A0A4R7J7I7_9ACTN|nr:BCCT family transporter [Naumannella halotolerans]TDT32706.1 choline/carnitine/betaine transport [Naumannella halotolerans]
MTRLFKGVDPVVFLGSAVIIAVFVVWGLVRPEGLGAVMATAMTWVNANFSWVFVLVATATLIFCLVLVLHPWGRIKLGPDDSKPEFRTFSWVSMMFAAGLGAGLLFYGVYEPVYHWANPPHGEAVPQSTDAALVGLRYTYFHWGFNGWAMYALLGGAMAYFAYRKGLPVLVSSVFTPLLGPNASKTVLGRIIDGLSIVATLFGTATALGLNGLQLNGGLNYLFGVPIQNGIAVVIILVVTTLFVISATTGVEKGINFLANLGAGATIALFIFFLVAGGSTVLVLSQGIQSIGEYVLQVIPMSMEMGIGDETWMAGWTIFYWAWWISWAPFVGMFVARISRGRTIREFIIGVVAAPTGFGFIWFAVVGSVGINLQVTGRSDILGVLDDPQVSLFQALDALPLPMISTAVCIVLIALFFISGADAASVVMATMASKGSIEPSRVVTVVLGLLMGGIACAMLLVGGLEALQQAAILGSVPFTFVMVGVAWCWVKALRDETRGGGGLNRVEPATQDKREPGSEKSAEPARTVGRAVTDPPATAGEA